VCAPAAMASRSSSIASSFPRTSRSCCSKSPPAPASRHPPPLVALPLLALCLPRPPKFKEGSPSPTSAASR
jgi:hypothetical protein